MACMVGSARVVLGRERAGFQFPAQEAFDFPLPPGVEGVPVSQCHEVSRLVSERPEGIVPGTLLTPLGLIQAASLYSQRVGIRCGLGVIKQRLVNALRRRGRAPAQIPSARLIYPQDRPDRRLLLSPPGPADPGLLARRHRPVHRAGHRELPRAHAGFCVRVRLLIGQCARAARCSRRPGRDQAGRACQGEWRA